MKGKKHQKHVSQRKPAKAGTTREPVAVVAKKSGSNTYFFACLFALAVITICSLWPILGNEFTNWDDDFYVLNNLMLRGPDWNAIFTQPVAANYHPVTMLSLAMNYQATGLQPSSYFLTNLFLHVMNTLLVFYFVWLLSKKEIWLSVFCAVLFGIHPMHVESVAWISERKDLLYTLFFILSLISYLQFFRTGKWLFYGISFLFAALSLLSKPAAVILPLILLLLDYYCSRGWNKRILLEKIPFFIAALVIGLLTLKFQSQAMAGLEVHSIGERMLFACYSTMIYFVKFLFPYQLSAFYPFPSTNHLSASVLISPVFVVAVAFLLWRFRKDRVVLFGILFFLINIALVVQLVSVGQTVVSERYSYLSYIGLAFLAGVKLESATGKRSGTFKWFILFVVAIICCFLTFQRTQVWKNSGTLWSDVLKNYPSAPIPRTNRANYYLAKANSITDAAEANALYLKALEDCEAALAADPANFIAHNGSGSINLKLNRNKEALADGDAMIKKQPDDSKGYAIRGKANVGLGKYEEALSDFNKGLELSPEDYNMRYDRGALLFNTFHKYREALHDFDQAILLHPQGVYYMTQSFCYYQLGEMDKAKEAAGKAIQMGETLSPDYLKLLGLQ